MVSLLSGKLSEKKEEEEKKQKKQTMLLTVNSNSPVFAVHGSSDTVAERARQSAPVHPPVYHPGVVDLELVVGVLVREVAVATVARRRLLRDVALPSLEGELHERALDAGLVQCHDVVFHNRYCHRAPEAHGSVKIAMRRIVGETNGLTI